MKDSENPLAFLSDLTTSELVLVGVKFGVDVPESLLALADPERLERARELRAKALANLEGANEGAIESDQPSEVVANPVPD